jgi:hypothetical protein
MSASPKYKGAWVQAEEVFEMFAQAGIDRKAAAQWLEAVWHDRGCPSIPLQHPDPARDLFRCSPRRFVPMDRATLGHGEIDWNGLILHFNVPIYREPEVGDIGSDVVFVRHESGRMLVKMAGKPIEVSRQQLVALLPKEKSKAGRKSTVDWDAVQYALENQIKQRGMFGPDNGTGWQNQADVERFVADLLSRRGESAVESTIRDNVKAMLKVIKAGN